MLKFYIDGLSGVEKTHGVVSGMLSGKHRRNEQLMNKEVWLKLSLFINNIKIIKMGFIL